MGLQRAHHDRLERRRVVRRDEGRRRDLPRAVRRTTSWGATAEQPLAHGDLVEHGAEREDVGAAVDARRARLLGRHVADLPCTASPRDVAWPLRAAMPKSMIFRMPS